MSLSVLTTLKVCCSRCDRSLFLAYDAFIKMNHRTITMMSVCLSGMGVHCDHTVHFSTDLSL